MITSTRATIEGRTITKDLGIVSGAIAPSKFFIKDMLANIRQMFGKEMKEYTDMIILAQKKALDRCAKVAEDMGADAVVNIRFMGTGVSAMSAEMMAYGTAVELEK